VMSNGLIQIYSSSLVILNWQNLIRLFLYLFEIHIDKFSDTILFLDSQLLGNFQDALKSILILFAKLNPGIRYVQGMNEVLAPLYYVFKNDPDEENAVSTSLQA